MSTNSAGTLISTRRVLNGRYAVGEVIGSGGTANVHLGRDTRSGRSVAIKMLRPDLARNHFFHSRFHREAQALAGLHHPTIAALCDTGFEELDGGSGTVTRAPFLVLEYVAGRSLRDLLTGHRPSLPAAIRHQVGVLAALEHSHAAGVIHRDIKPANVMITTEGAVKVVDFGIARGNGDPGSTMTQHHAFLGTPLYVSPEQVRGETGDVRSDLYSAGCLLYELLVGRPPFVGDDPVFVAYQHVHEEPARVSTHRPHLTPALDAVLVRALAKDRTDRFHNARAFTEALLSATKGMVHDDARPHRGVAECAQSMADHDAARHERCA